LADAAPAPLSQRQPDVDVSLVTSERSHSMLRADIDVAVLFGDGRFKQGESHWLFSEEVFPVCSPQLLNERPLPLPAERCWSFRCCTCAASTAVTGSTGAACSANWESLAQAPAPGQLRFDNYTLLIQAAIGGQGVAIGWRHLVDELAGARVCCAGRLHKR
jgi:DNA-binding transcriptional LysR family regulator